MLKNIGYINTNIFFKIFIGYVTMILRLLYINMKKIFLKTMYITVLILKLTYGPNLAFYTIRKCEFKTLYIRLITKKFSPKNRVKFEKK